MNCNLKIYNETDFKKNRLSELLTVFNNLENIKFYLPFEMIEKIINAEFDLMENEANKKIKIKFEFFDYYKISFRNLLYNFKMKFFYCSKYNNSIIEDKEALGEKYFQLQQIKYEDSENEDSYNEDSENEDSEEKEKDYLKKYSFENFQNQFKYSCYLNFYIEGWDKSYNKEEINFIKVYHNIKMDGEALQRLFKHFELINGLDEKFKKYVDITHYITSIIKENDYNNLNKIEDNKNNLLLISRFYKFYIDYQNGEFKNIKFIYNYIKSLIKKLKELVDLMDNKKYKRLQFKYKRIYTDKKYFNFGGCDIYEEYKYILGWSNNPINKNEFLKIIKRNNDYKRMDILNFINEKYFINDLYDNFEEIEHNEEKWRYRKFIYNDFRYFQTMENFNINRHILILDKKEYTNDFNIYNDTVFKNIKWLNIINNILEYDNFEDLNIYDYQYYDDDYRNEEGIYNNIIVDKLYYQSLKEHIKIKLKNNIDKNKNHIII